MAATLEGGPAVQAKAIRLTSQHGKNESKESIDGALSFFDLTNDNVLALCTYPVGRAMVEAKCVYRKTMDRTSGEVGNIGQALAGISKAVALSKKAVLQNGEPAFEDFSKAPPSPRYPHPWDRTASEVALLQERGFR